MGLLRRCLVIVLVLELLAVAGIALHWWLVEHPKPRVVVFTGGGDDNPFSQFLRRGAQTAAHHTTCRVEFIDSNWDLETMLRQVRQAIASRPQAICLLGHPGEDALGSLVAEARAAGIIVTCQNIDLPVLRECYRDDGFGYVGNEQHAAGMRLGRGCAERMTLSADTTAVMLGTQVGSSSDRTQRGQGVVDALRQRGANAVLESTTPQLDGSGPIDPAALAALLNQIRARHPRLRLLVADAPTLALACLPILDGWKAVPPIEVACFDLTPAVAEALRARRLLVVADQQPFLQGYLPVMQTMLTLRQGATGMVIDTGCSLIDRESVMVLTPLIQRGIR